MGFAFAIEIVLNAKVAKDAKDAIKINRNKSLPLLRRLRRLRYFFLLIKLDQLNIL